MRGLRNTESEYGTIAIFLHWAMAILIITLLILGLYMTGLPDGMHKTQSYGWHKQLGIVVLTLAVIRLVWRLGNITPRLLSLIPLWQVIVARATHWTFYTLMVALPLTGWMMSSSAGRQVSFFGLFILPDLVSANQQRAFWFREIHHFLAFTMIALICLHVAAALKHQFINKDDVLTRMLP